MRILVFGASGQTGQEVVRQALAHNHYVTAFARHKEKITIKHANLRVVGGNVSVKPVIEAVMPGHDAVISTLGVSKAMTHDRKVITGIQNIIEVMEVQGIPVFIYQSFIGVAESRRAAGFLLRYIARYPLREEIADHEAKEDIVRNAKLDWTIVRPPKLTNGKATGYVRSGMHIKAHSPLPMLSRADVAAFMLNEVQTRSYPRCAVRLLP